MPPAPISIRVDGHSLTLEAVEAVARGGRPAALTASARKAVEDSARETARLAQGDAAVYGVNTGLGIFSNRRIPPEERADLSRNLILSHSVGVGDSFPRDVTRAAILIRANTLAIGLSGVTLPVVDGLLNLLEKGITPAIPSQGSLGSSGDLAPLAHLAMTLAAPELVPDTPAAWIGDDRMPLRQALERAGLKPIALGPKDGLGLINGATFATALLTLACLDLARVLDAAEAAAAVSLEALRGASAAFDDRLHAARPHPGQRRVAARLRDLTRGSRLIDSSDQVQDAYSLRCIPQVLGPVWEILEFCRHVAERELNAATDNPLLFGGKAISGGNFHGEPIGLACDYLKIAASEVGALSERRTFRLLSAHTSAGLPPMLVAQPEHAGVRSGLMMLQYTAASLVLENEALAASSSVRSLPTSADQEDHNANATTAARTLRQVIDHVAQIVAIELLTAAQALDLRLRADPSRHPGEGVQAIHARIRQQVPVFETDTVVTEHLERLTSVVRAGDWLSPKP